MKNEFVNVHNEPKTILLRAWIQREQQHYKLEILQISIKSSTVNVIFYVNDMRGMQLSVYRTVSHNGSCTLKIHIFNSEFSDGVLLFDIVILILHIPNALLISVS
jgi:hypothetical protein